VPEGPAPASFGPQPRSGSLAEKWPEVLGLIGERLGNGTAGLLNGSVPSETASGTVTIELPAGAAMQKQMCQTNGRSEQIAQVLGDYLGRNVRLELRLVESDSLREAYLADAIWGFREAAAATRRSETLNEEQRRDFSASATTNLGQILAYQDRLLEAAEVHEQYLTEYPDDAQARSRLASLLVMRINELRDSVQQTQDPVEQGDPPAHIDSLEARVLKQYGELLAMEGLGLEADEYHEMGIGLYQLDKFEEAAMAFRKALELQPYRPQSFELLAHSVYAVEDYDALVTVAEQLVDRYPNDVSSLALLANAYRETERPEEALEVFERREALPFQLVELDLRGGAASGSVENLNLEPGTPIEVEFTFYDNAGNVIGSGRLSIDAPQEGERSSFRVSPEAPAAETSGFTYRVVQPT